MTAITTAPPSDGTSSLRTSGIFFVIAGAGAPAQVALFQLSSTVDSDSGSYVPSGPALLVTLLSMLAGVAFIASSVIGFTLLFAWNQNAKAVVFFVPALGSFLGALSFGFDPGSELITALVIGAATILSGLLVLQQRMFLTAGSLIFLLAMIVAQAPIAGMFIDPSSSVLTFELRYIVGPCYVLAGAAMVVGARARARLIQAGRIER